MPCDLTGNGTQRVRCDDDIKIATFQHRQQVTSVVASHFEL